MIGMSDDTLRLGGLIQDIKKLTSDPTDDFFDRISCAVSVCLLTGFTLLTAGGLYFGAPLECIYHAESPEHWQEYYTDRCYVEGTFAHKEPEDPALAIYAGATVQTREIQYYQWVPYFLFVQALCFLFPKQIWKLCINAQSFDFLTIITEAEKLGQLLDKDHREHLKKIVRHMVKEGTPALDKSRTCFGRSFSFCHVIVKWLYLLNAVMQFFFLVKFVGADDYMWGLQGAINNFERERSPLFPLETFCELQHIYSFQMQHFNFQCILPWNMINEKIYIFLWFWLLFVIVMALFSAVYDTALFLIAPLRRRLVLDLLGASPLINSRKLEQHLVRRFAANILGCDGLLLLRLIKEQSGSIVAGQITSEMWRQATSEVQIDCWEEYDVNGEVATSIDNRQH